MKIEGPKEDFPGWRVGRWKVLRKMLGKYRWKHESIVSSSLFYVFILEFTKVVLTLPK